MRKHRIITDEMVEFLQEEHPRHPGKTRARVLAEKRIERSEDDSDELEKLLDRVEGKVPQPTQQLPTESLSESVPKDDRSNPVDP